MNIEKQLDRLTETVNRVADERNDLLEAGRAMLAALEAIKSALPPHYTATHIAVEAIAQAKAAGISANAEPERDNPDNGNRYDNSAAVVISDFKTEG